VERETPREIQRVYEGIYEKAQEATEPIATPCKETLENLEASKMHKKAPIRGEKNQKGIKVLHPPQTPLF
jgi:hypothetical protein